MAYAPNRAPSVSDQIVIMTRVELKAREEVAFQRGVERGKFEAYSQAQGLAGHLGATENTSSASSDAAVRPANS